MADDNRFRANRPGRAYPRVAEPPRSDEYSGGSDPLAELARLIGKSDPYAQFGLSDASPPGSEESYQRYAPAREDRRAPGHEQHRRAAHEPYRAVPRESYQEPYSSSHSSSNGGRERGGYDRQPVARPHDPPLGGWRAPRPAGGVEPAFEQAGAYEEEHDSRPRAQMQAEEPYYGQPDDYGRHADDDLHADPALDQAYDDHARAGRRGGLATALALIGCAMLGTAGAYGYRSYYGPTAATQPPPVITADVSTPTKIVPAAAGDAQSGKTIQDRLANAGKEQVVSKQEEPVALKDLGTQAAPRVVLPAPVAPLSAAQTPTGTNSSGGNEPKKVRTVTIRPDGSDPVGRAAGAGQAAGQVPAQPAARPAAVPRNSGGPISLDPQEGEPTSAAPARIRSAAAPTPARGSETGGVSSGGLMVQLSSQKTEAEASSSFRSLQSKFPNELGGRNPVIKRADLGAKGVFYRTMVGPFASAQEAHQFCASFKAAGGTCVVPSN
jgi:hypothetical protein